MKPVTKRKIQSVVLAGCMLVLSISASNHTQNKNEQDEVPNEMFTAGVASVFNTENTTPFYITSGIASVLIDFDRAEDLAVIDTDHSQVASGQIPEEEITEAMEFLGYTNLAIANVEGCMLNVRKGPGTNYSVVGKMAANSACEVLKTEGDWTQITSGKVTGYVSSEYLLFGKEALKIAKEHVMTVATVTTASLNVRKEPTTDSRILTKVEKGMDLTFLELAGDWAKVEIDEVTGYVSTEFVEIADKLPTALSMKELQYGTGISEKRIALVEEALKYVGNRYVWGGTSLTNGVDCSGYTMKIYEKFGVKLPHHSGSQPGYGKKIKASEAKPGDLFFYGSGGRISHVAIYIGNGKIVHASNPHVGIIISNAYGRDLICVASYLP